MIKEIVFSKFIEEKPDYKIRKWIDESGREVLDDRPVSISFPQQTAPASLIQLIHQLYAEQQAQAETFEDADDFDVPEEESFDLYETPYEQNFDHLESPATSSAEPSAVPAGSPEVKE